MDRRGAVGAGRALGLGQEGGIQGSQAEPMSLRRAEPFTEKSPRGDPVGGPEEFGIRTLQALSESGAWEN